MKQFAQMMVTDHTKAMNELMQAVKGQGTDEPTTLDAIRQPSGEVARSTSHLPIPNSQTH